MPTFPMDIGIFVLLEVIVILIPIQKMFATHPTRPIGHPPLVKMRGFAAELLGFLGWR
jgi:hypothetical protein